VKNPSRLKAIVLALLVTFLWSTSFILIKWGLAENPPLTYAGLRYTLAFLCLLPFAYLDRALTNDPSFPTNSDDFIAQGISFALLLTGAGTLSGFLLDASITGIGLAVNQGFEPGVKLLKDEAVFGKALSTYVDGYPLAAKVGFDEYMNPVEEPFGDGTKIMLHPLLKAYWQEQYINESELGSPDIRFQNLLKEYEYEFYLEYFGRN